MSDARDANWATKVERLHVDDDARAHGYNVEGRRVAGPQQGFGRLWERTSTVRLGDAVTPERLIADWRADFGSYWPGGGRFYGAMTGVAPGNVAPLTAGPVMTGILVLYADETSFTFMTPEGHLFAAMITFSASQEASGTVARIDILLRTSDPLYELGWPFIKPGEDRFWAGTLRNLAQRHGVRHPLVLQTTRCIDRGRLWRNWRNVFHNSGIRTGLHLAAAPVRKVRGA
jgi:hypothetical protein